MVLRWKQVNKLGTYYGSFKPPWLKVLHLCILCTTPFVNAKCHSPSNKYYTYTEIYSLKSYVVDFHMPVSSTQSEEWKMFSHIKKMIRQSELRMMFFTCEENDTSNQKPQRCASFMPKLPPLVGVCSLQCPSLWDVNEENCRQSQQNNNGRGKTEWDLKLKLCILSELFCLLLIFKLTILLKFIHFQLLLVIPGLPHTLTLIMTFTKF